MSSWGVLTGAEGMCGGERYNQVLSFLCALGFGAVMCVVAWGVGTRLVRVEVLMLNNNIIDPYLPRRLVSSPTAKIEKN